MIKSTIQARPSLTESAGRGVGALLAMAMAVMPLRLWAIMVASVVLIIRVFRTESVLDVARSTAVFLCLVAFLIGSAVFKRHS